MLFSRMSFHQIRISLGWDDVFHRRNDDEVGARRHPPGGFELADRIDDTDAHVVVFEVDADVNGVRDISATSFPEDRSPRRNTLPKFYCGMRNPRNFGANSNFVGMRMFVFGR